MAGRPRIRSNVLESVGLEVPTLESVRRLAVLWDMTLSEALRVLVRAGESELAFPLAVGERAIVNADAQGHGSTNGAPFQLRVGLSMADVLKLKGTNIK